MQFLLGHCITAFEQHQNILLTLFLAGLFGGLTHCSGMCGPFVAVQVKQNNQKTILGKLSGASLIPYHLGRLTTYIILGVTAAFLSKQIIGTSLQKWLATLFLAIAATIFIFSALPKIKNRIIHIRYKGFAKFGNFIGLLAERLTTNYNLFSRYVLGFLLGFLPCGLIFAALMAVASTGSPFTAALAMTLFTLGTFPALFLVGFGSQFAYRKWPNAMQKIAQSIMIFNGFSLFLLAGNIAFK